MHRRTACLLALTIAWTAGRLAADEPRLATDSIAEDGPRAAFVWSYLCKGRPPHRQGDLLTCPCLDEAGAPRPEEPAAGGAHVGAVYLGSFTGTGARQALVALGGCGPMNSPAALLVLAERDGTWRKAAYQPPAEVAVPGPVDLHDVTGTCLTWSAPGDPTRLVCENSAAYFGRGFAPAFAAAAVYAVELAAGGEPGYDDLLHLADNTHASCDAMPLRHLARIAGWRLDARNPHPRLTLHLETGDKRTGQHGNTDLCHADRPAAATVTLAFAWDGAAWKPGAESAAERAKLEAIYRTLQNP